MPLSTQIKVMQVLRELLLGSGMPNLAHGAGKPEFPGGNAAPLPRATPESKGVDSAFLEGLYTALSCAPNANVHSLLVVKDGAVISEGEFSPFRGTLWHVSHSLCKSIVGAAVGLAIEEGLFGLDDAVLPLLAVKVPFPPKYAREVTVRHLLTMTSGFSFNEVSEAVETEWLKGVFSSKFSFPPGTAFAYNSMNTYVLAALVRKASGQPLLDYLRPHLLDPMGFGPIAWETSPEGIEKAGWGMYIMPEDMAKFGLLYLQKGRWHCDGQTRQLLPEAWVELSTTPHQQDVSGFCYGFQMWVEAGRRYFAMNGMFGQYIIICPETGMVLALTGGNPNLFVTSPAFSVLQEWLLEKEARFPAALPESPVALRSLRSCLSRLYYRTPYQKTRPLVPAPAKRRLPAHIAPVPRVKQPDLSAFTGILWSFDKNRAGILPLIIQVMNSNLASGIKSLAIAQEGNRLLLHWTEGKGTAVIPAGLGHYVERVLQVGDEKFLIASRAALKTDEDDIPVLKIDICFLEHSSSRQLKLRVEDGRLRLIVDEQPQFQVAMESILQQAKAGGMDTADGLGGLLANSEYLHYRIGQTCRPEVWGTVHKPGDT